MRLAALARASLLTAAVVTGGCGGGASGPAAPPAAGPPTASGTVKLTLTIPRRASSAARGLMPRYVSPNMTSLAFYDGSTLVYVGNFVPEGSPPFTTVYANAASSTTVTANDCTFTTAITCTMSITAPVGNHTFGIVTYPNDQTSTGGNPPAFTGVILSEGDAAVTVTQGTNTGVVMTLLGVAASMTWSVPPFIANGSSGTISYQINDAGGSQIIQPGNYDNGPVVITASVGGQQVSQIAPPATNGNQSFSYHCTTGSPVTLTATAGSAPATAWPFGLTYTSPTNYPGTTIGSVNVSCENT